MDSRTPQDEDDQTDAAPPHQSEQSIRLMLRASREDIAAGRVTPLATVIERLREGARQTRTEQRSETPQVTRRPAP
jgi:hypothetical protein